LPLDDTAGFFVNFYQQTVSNGSTLGPLPLISFINVLPGTVYTGSFSLAYTTDQGGPFETNRVPFIVTVTSPVPEPATMLLLGQVSSGCAQPSASVAVEKEGTLK
jgi:hypothetical protein